MCFLKTLKPLDEIQLSRELTTDQSSCQQISQSSQGEYSFLNKLLISETPVFLTKQDQLLQNLMKLINSNNIFLKNIEQKLQHNEQNLLSSHQELSEMISECNNPFALQETSHTQSEKNHSDQQNTVCHPLLTRLFGNKKYHYKLQLQQDFSTTIFKERNINISIKLIDEQSTQKVLNSNIVHLCLGVCDENGLWIQQNKGGQSFMKGKTEIEMYHGQASFLKIYPRDISRSYPGGKINFVVYSKPSMLKFSSSSNIVEKMVNSNQIEPLLISGITIKAKKG